MWESGRDCVTYVCVCVCVCAFVQEGKGGGKLNSIDQIQWKNELTFSGVYDDDRPPDSSYIYIIPGM